MTEICPAWTPDAIYNSLDSKIIIQKLVGDYSGLMDDKIVLSWIDTGDILAKNIIKGDEMNRTDQKKLAEWISTEAIVDEIVGELKRGGCNLTVENVQAVWLDVLANELCGAVRRAVNALMRMDELEMADCKTPTNAEMRADPTNYSPIEGHPCRDGLD